MSETAWSKVRCIRIAFLVQDGATSNLTLDGIFADCYGRWGGRSSLIVPCSDNQILAPYWHWLEAYDPDLIVSYVDLHEEELSKIHELINPSVFHRHEIHRADVHGFKPDYKFRPLTSLSTAFSLARYREHAGGPLKIIDSHFTETPSLFFADNFGVYLRSYSTGMYPNDAAATATLVPVATPERRNPHVRIPSDTVASEDEAFQLVSSRRATSLAYLSALFASRIEIRNGTWSSSFNLVVGETFQDRVMFWNGWHFIPRWLDETVACLRISAEQAADDQFVAHLAEFLKANNRVNDGTGGEPHLTIRSCSEPLAAMNALAGKLRAASVWGVIRTEAVADLLDLVPAKETFNNVRDDTRSSQFGQNKWRAFEWHGDEARPPDDQPEHLMDAPPRQSFAMGFWARDFSFGLSDPSTAMSGRNLWVLPKRWRVAGSFSIYPLIDVPFEIIPPARRGRGGCLTAFCGFNRVIEKIIVPDPKAALKHALSTDGRHWRDGASPYMPPGNKVHWMQPSGESRYLAGVLGLAGSLEDCERFLLHPFLRQQFEELGGLPNPTAKEIEPTINKITKLKSFTDPFDLKNERERLALANLIVWAAKTVKVPHRTIQLDDLVADWDTYRKRFWPDDRPAQDFDDERIVAERRSLLACLSEMRGRQLFFQGYEWPCKRCGHINWAEFSTLSVEKDCEICGSRATAPIEPTWMFRGNEFLIRSLREHSALSLIWVLCHLRSRAKTSFLFVGPSEFGWTANKEGANAEGDLMALVDGKALLFEVKSSWSVLRHSDVNKFISLSERLRPDVAVLAVMQDFEGRGPDFTTAEARLAAQGIKFQVLTPRNTQMDDGPYLGR